MSGVVPVELQLGEPAADDANHVFQFRLHAGRGNVSSSHDLAARIDIRSTRDAEGPRAAYRRRDIAEGVYRWLFGRIHAGRHVGAAHRAVVTRIEIPFA